MAIENLEVEAVKGCPLYAPLVEAAERGENIKREVWRYLRAGDMIEVVSTRSFAPRDRLAAWNDLIASTYFGMVVDADSDVFDARLGVWSLGDLRIVRPRSRPARITRTRSTGAADAGRYLVHILTEGSVVLEQNGKRCALVPGDMAICAADDAYRFDAASTHEMLVTEFEGHSLWHRCPRLDAFLARPISGKLAPTRILRRYLDVLWQEGRGQMPVGHDAIQQGILLDLTVACLTGEGGRTPPDDARCALLRRADDVIRERLGEHDLGPAGVAAVLGTPLRTLQAAAARAGTTVNGMIADVRLKRAADLLRRNSATPIADIAFDCGFADPSYFARRFQQAHGVSPSRFRD